MSFLSKKHLNYSKYIQNKNNRYFALLNSVIIIFFFVITCILPFAQPQCLSYYEYLDSTTSLCLPCAYNCLTCLDSVTCAFCADEYYIDSNTNSCLNCPFGCQVCTSSTTC